MTNKPAEQRTSSVAASGAGSLETFQDTDAIDESFISPAHHESNEHIALLYNSREEQLATVTPFIQQGLGRGEKCIYVLADNTQSDLTDALQDRGVDVEAVLEAGELEFLTPDTYVAGGALDPDQQLAALKEVIDNAVSAYPGVRVAVEMTCFLDDDLSYDELVAYEERYNTVSEDVDATALCQYDRQRFPPEVIRNVIQAHPHLIADGTLSHNVQYVTPEVYFNPETPDREIEQMLSMTKALAEAESELKRQNDRLEEFASIVSHDLRNPLRVAEGHLELARDVGSEEHFHAVENAHERMDTLIDDILSFARTDDQVDALEWIDLGDIVEDCWEHVPTEQAILVVETDCRLRADENLLRQIVENLLGNAVEHAGKEVTVRVGKLSDDAGFYLADDGPGIPEARRDDVFEVGVSTTEQGTGFGLSIVKELADVHGWSVTITESTDGGARFEIANVDFTD